MKTHIHIKTYRKNLILDDILSSIKEVGLDHGNVITIGDDEPGGAIDIFNKHEFVEAYLTGNRHGIWANNNRGIKYFLEKTDCEALMLLDHDIVFKKLGILEEIEEAYCEGRRQHITGFVKGIDGSDGLEQTFPFQGESKNLKWHNGSHGVLLWQTRELVKKVGYQLVYPYFYGAEHAEYSHRLLSAQGYAALWWYPVLKRSPKFFEQNKRDWHEYDVDISKVMETNQKKMHERDQLTVRGVMHFQDKHGLDRELVVPRDTLGNKQEILDLLQTVKKGKKKRRR
jgi:hypothetical protein